MRSKMKNQKINDLTCRDFQVQAGTSRYDSPDYAFSLSFDKKENVIASVAHALITTPIVVGAAVPLGAVSTALNIKEMKLKMSRFNSVGIKSIGNQNHIDKLRPSNNIKKR